MFVVFDADMTKNRDVHDSAAALQKALLAEGANGVLFVDVPGRAKEGLDDVLARVRPPERRTPFIERLMEKALDKLPRAPVKKKDRGAFFTEDGRLLAETLAKAIVADHPGALTAERKIVLYRDGVYVPDDAFIEARVGELLGEDHRDSYLRDATGRLRGLLYTARRQITERLTEPLLNVRNGLLDLRTETLHPHDSARLSVVQLPVAWNPEATCPTYDEWMTVQLPEQWDDLEETVAPMLDPRRTPTKAAILYGPTRSGKSTMIRLLEALVGKRNLSSVSLHQMADNRFMAAEVYGKSLNAASEITSGEVEDVKLFLKLTGDDSVTAERKNQQPFEFHNKALFVFATNELPTVAETSNAYSERMKPFHWWRSFAGKEDPRIEAAMLGELEGILVRLVRAWQRFDARGTYLATDATVRRDFETRSNRVHQFVVERCRVWPVAGRKMLPDDHTTTKRELGRAFNLWAERNQGGRMGERKVWDKALGVPGIQVIYRQTSRNEALNLTVSRSEEPDNPPPGRPDDGPENDDGTDGAPPQNHERVTFTILETGGYQEASSKSSLSGNSFTNLSDTNSSSPTLEGRENKENNTVTGVVGSERGYRANTGWKVTSLTNAPSAVVFDLETASSDDLWRCGPGFVRLAAVAAGDGQVDVTDDAASFAAFLRASAAGLVAGHNILGFDLLALAHHHGLELLSFKDRVRDTMLLAALADPPLARKENGEASKLYGLDVLAKKYLGDEKSHDLKALARKHGGFDRIPLDDPEYVTYARHDVELSRRLLEVLPWNAYAEREHRIGLLAAQITLNGFRVDADLLRGRLAYNEKQKAHWLDVLQEHGLPTTRKDGTPALSPQATAEGNAAIKRAFEALGAPFMPKTEKGGRWDIGKEGMAKMRQQYGHLAGVEALCEAVESLNGIRSVYQTVSDWLAPDGRVHASIAMFQSTGRWSVTKPGLTVMGKRGGKHVERSIFLPDEGDVLLAVDMAQVDARSVAALSGDADYQALFREGDLWTAMAVQTGTTREVAKILGHAWNYNAGVARLTAATGIAEDVIQEFDRSMRQRFPHLVDWKTNMVEAARAGDLLNNGWGRTLRCDPERAYTQGPASMGQSYARDVLMEGLLRLWERSPWLVPCLRAVIHDEVVLSVPIEVLPEAQQEVLAALSFERDGMQFEAGVAGIGPDWGACYSQ